MSEPHHVHVVEGAGIELDGKLPARAERLNVDPRHVGAKQVKRRVMKCDAVLRERAVSIGQLGALEDETLPARRACQRSSTVQTPGEKIRRKL